MILTDSEVRSLKAILNWWEWFGYVSTAIVFLGCVGEFIAEFTRVAKREESKHKLSRLSLIILILGIAGELLGAVRTSQLSGQLIANIEQRAGDAEQRAGEANKLASENEKEAEGLRKDAESERLARIKIEARVAWRHLSEGQKVEIGTALRHFSNQGVSFWYNAADIEAAMFTADIAEAATKAGTLRVYAPGGVMKAQEGGHGNLGKPIERLETGVIVASTSDTRSCSLAEAIMKELNVRGFDAIARKDPRTDVAPQVWVNVEPRPEGPQGEFKLQAARETKAKKTANGQ
jgi:hypothetical protein